MPEQQIFLSLITGSFSTPAAENPTVAMIEAAYEHHHVDTRYAQARKYTLSTRTPHDRTVEIGSESRVG